MRQNNHISLPFNRFVLHRLPACAQFDRGMQPGILSGNNIVIMGGTTGLGLSAARACINAGANVLAVGRNPVNVEKAQGSFPERFKAIAADATDPAAAEKAILQLTENFGPLHGIYHVAGGSGRRAGDGPLHDLSDEGIEFTLRLNLQSVLYTNRAAVRQFRKQGGGGSILNMGSVLGYSPSPEFFATHTYAACKGGIIGLTLSAAAYYAGESIRFNVIAPALVETPMAQRAANDAAIQQFIKTKQPLDGGRIGKPEDLDAAVVFLLSSGARFVTGQVLAVDGGWCVSEGQVPEREA
jgi:NAD(P)-dependent dehydrogenase (short-subunit alcohol dehydrogenase family)